MGWWLVLTLTLASLASSASSIQTDPSWRPVSGNQRLRIRQIPHPKATPTTANNLAVFVHHKLWGGASNPATPPTSPQLAAVLRKVTSQRLLPLFNETRGFRKIPPDVFLAPVHLPPPTGFLRLPLPLLRDFDVASSSLGPKKAHPPVFLAPSRAPPPPGFARFPLSPPAPNPSTPAPVVFNPRPPPLLPPNIPVVDASRRPQSLFFTPATPRPPHIFPSFFTPPPFTISFPPPPQTFTTTTSRRPTTTTTQRTTTVTKKPTTKVTKPPPAPTGFPGFRLVATPGLDLASTPDAASFLRGVLPEGAVVESIVPLRGGGAGGVVDVAGGTSKKVIETTLGADLQTVVQTILRGGGSIQGPSGKGTELELLTAKGGALPLGKHNDSESAPVLWAPVWQQALVPQKVTTTTFKPPFPFRHSSRKPVPYQKPLGHTTPTPSTSPVPTRPPIYRLPLDQELELQKTTTELPVPKGKLIGTTQRTPKPTMQPKTRRPIPTEATGAVVFTPDDDVVVMPQGEVLPETLFPGATTTPSTPTTPLPSYRSPITKKSSVRGFYVTKTPPTPTTKPQQADDDNDTDWGQKLGSRNQLVPSTTVRPTTNKHVPPPWRRLRRPKPTTETTTVRYEVTTPTPTTLPTASSEEADVYLVPVTSTVATSTSTEASSSQPPRQRGVRKRLRLRKRGRRRRLQGALRTSTGAELSSAESQLLETSRERNDALDVVVEETGKGDATASGPRGRRRRVKGRRRTTTTTPSPSTEVSVVTAFGTDQPDVVGVSTATEVSVARQTRICFMGRCVTN